jgi:hypothetical protein
MPQAAIGAYLERLPGHQAELKMMIFEAARTAQMNPDDAQTIIAAWENCAFGGRVPAPPATDFALSQIGIGVRHVPRKPGGSSPRPQSE